ncbi:MAG: hypothetical protein JSV20_06250 [Candidatus Bathyarchaeota archaeon]|nr:MAG: hypothetical protein JSV20_06250 [Candidatus Bathyarchaeota archaeon]
MTFICPQCSSASLKIALRIELPPDSRSDEITIQTIRCSQCSFAGLAIYEESRRGALDSESVYHRGYCVKADTLTSIQKQIRECPEPTNPYCQCRNHKTLSRLNRLGRWNWLDDISHFGPFKLVRAS